MSLVVNNNMMAANTARNLNAHYGRLATSTQRLSSGLRVNSAADDAAGLAIRELQRADIAALQQGARNANDAISMIQVADGSLGIIDEKLIRMKELAEQAATGTYDSTQRMMIESEYQAMASEITRIANATDFNGTKLLDGTLAGDHDGSGLISTGKMKIHFGTGNDSAEDYYYVEIGECTSEAFGLGNNSTWQDVQNRGVAAFKESMQQQIKNDTSLTAAQKGELLNQLENAGDLLNDLFAEATNPLRAGTYWDATAADGQKWPGNSDLMDKYMAAWTTSDVANDFANDPNEAIITAAKNAIAGAIVTTVPRDDGAGGTTNVAFDETVTADEYDAMLNSNLTALNTAINALVTAGTLTNDQGFAVKSSISSTIDSLRNKPMPPVDSDAADRLVDEITQKLTDTAGLSLSTVGEFWNGLRETEKQKLQYAWGQAAVYNLANGNGSVYNNANLDFPGNIYTDLQGAFTPAQNDKVEIALKAISTKIGHMDFAGYTVETQEDAQMALDAINEAIVSKDKIRAHLGAAQNRLENTVSNLNIQAENLQAAESRISDVDVATEMTQFVRNQILTQSAVAMLSQANSLPQMAMQLIGG